MSRVKGEIIEAAFGVINGERQDLYGDPEDSFSLIAEIWTLYAGGAKEYFTSEDVAMMMVFFKLAREIHQHKLDNLVDAAGYLGILGDLRKGEK